MDVEAMMRNTLQEMERLLESKNVIGEPIVVEGNTIIPLMSTGFGFGAGGGTGSSGEPRQEGAGGGTGAGGGVRPVAVLIVNPQGVRIERIEEAGGLAKLGEAIGRAIETSTRAGGREQREG